MARTPKDSLPSTAAGPLDPANAVEAPVEVVETDLPPGIAPPDSWDDFFEAPEGRVACHVRRLVPETWPDPETGERVNMRGFCGEIPYAVDVEVYVAEHWGGGVYLVSKQVNNRFTQQRKVFIPGPPLVPRRGGPAFTAASPEAPRTPAVRPGVEVEGVPLDGSRDEWEERVQRFALTTKLLASLNPPDINAKLVEVLLNRVERPATEVIREQLELIRAARELVPSGGDESGGGEGWAGMLSKALEVLPALIGARGATVPTPRRLPPPVQPTGAQGPSASPPGATVAPETEALESPQMSYHELLTNALAVIESNFLTEPRTSPAEVANALLVALPLGPELRAKVPPQANALAVLGVRDLEEEFRANPSLRAEWFAYVAAVAEAYGDPARVSPLEGLKL